MSQGAQGNDMPADLLQFPDKYTFRHVPAWWQ